MWNKYSGKYQSRIPIEPEWDCLKSVLLQSTLIYTPLQLDDTTAEFKIGQKALFDRHPEMKDWPISKSNFRTKIHFNFNY